MQSNITNASLRDAQVADQALRDVNASQAQG